MDQDLDGLTAVLGSIFRGSGSSQGRLTDVHRDPTPYVTTFACEIVTCRFSGGKKLQLFCKYAAAGGKCSHGQRGGVAYEAEVYRHVLQPTGATAPAFYGSYKDRKTGGTWLILEYLKRSLRAGKVPRLKAMKLAAHWIGEFHSANEARVSGARSSFLTAYDSAFYLGWPRRASRFAGRLRERFTWLPDLCKSVKAEIAALAALPQTVIHGEYYPHNIMFQAGVVRPVDWETAAIAPGEIDLASLTDGWPPEVSRDLEAEYQHARWPFGAPANFPRNLDRARAYLQLRWLGDLPEWTGDTTRWKRLHAVSKRLQLL